MVSGLEAGVIMFTGADFGQRRGQDIISTYLAIGNKEDMDGFGFRGIGISNCTREKIIFLKKLKIHWHKY
jgi:hypothetical protein